jgi:hypothetical protein
MKYFYELYLYYDDYFLRKRKCRECRQCRLPPKVFIRKVKI